MKSVNYPLRKAYMARLDGIPVGAINVPLYYQQAPDDEQGQAYMTLNEVSNVDDSTTNSSHTSTSMQVQIHTWSENGNAGKLADDIAGAVYEIIYPTSQAVLDLSADNLQMVSTKMDGDRTGNSVWIGNREFITRIITFNHWISHK